MRSSLAVCTLLASTTFACSGGTEKVSANDAGADASPSNDAGPPPHLDAGADAAPPVDAGAPSDASPAADAAPPDFGPAGSVVWVRSHAGPNGAADNYTILANFLTGVASGPSCVGGTAMGSCCFEPLHSCEVFSDGGGTCEDAGTPPVDAGASTDAGACAVFDNNANVGLLALTDDGVEVAQAQWDPDNGYSGVQPLDGGIIQWSPGDLLGASAPGGGCFSSFTGATHAVAPLVWTLPATAPASADLVVTWTPDPNAQNVALTMDPYQIGGGPTGNVTCSAADAAGTITVPAAILGMMGSGEAFVSLTRTSVTDAPSVPPIDLLSAFQDSSRTTTIE